LTASKLADIYQALNQPDSSKLWLDRAQHPAK